MYPVVIVPDDAHELPEQIGTKFKFWYRDIAGKLIQGFAHRSSSGAIALNIRWPRNRENVPHDSASIVQNAMAYERQRATLVPEDGQRLAQRFTLVGHLEDGQRISIDFHRG